MTLYTGRYNENGNIFGDFYFRTAWQNHQIANVYIDITLASAVTQNSALTAAKAISDIRGLKIVDDELISANNQ